MNEYEYVVVYDGFSAMNVCLKHPVQILDEIRLPGEVMPRLIERLEVVLDKDGKHEITRLWMNEDTTGGWA